MINAHTGRERPRSWSFLAHHWELIIVSLIVVFILIIVVEQIPIVLRLLVVIVLLLCFPLEQIRNEQEEQDTTDDQGDDAWARIKEPIEKTTNRSHCLYLSVHTENGPESSIYLSDLSGAC